MVYYKETCTMNMHIWLFILNLCIHKSTLLRAHLLSFDCKHFIINYLHDIAHAYLLLPVWCIGFFAVALVGGYILREMCKRIVL